MKPPEVAQIHREICERENCEYLDKIDYADPCAFCPNGHFGRYELTGCDDKQSMRGLGDAVAAVAQPIAKGIDAVLGTNIAGCGGCKKRQTKLNEILPFK